MIWQMVNKTTDLPVEHYRLWNWVNDLLTLYLTGSLPIVVMQIYAIIIRSHNLSYSCHENSVRWNELKASRNSKIELFWRVVHCGHAINIVEQYYNNNISFLFAGHAPTLQYAPQS